MSHSIMRKFEELINVIQNKKISWQTHTVRSLSAATGYSHDACAQALKKLRKTNPDKSDFKIIKDLSDDTIEFLLIEALKANPGSERLIRCAIDFKVKIKGGEGEGTKELDMQKLFEMGLFKIEE